MKEYEITKLPKFYLIENPKKRWQKSFNLFKMKKTYLYIVILLTLFLFLLYYFNRNQAQKDYACNIKGNISQYTGNTKIYHLPICPYYNNTTIELNSGERRFCSEEEAINAGWRKAENCNE